MNFTKLTGHLSESVLSQLPETLAKFNINGPLRLSHFLAQCSHESAGFTRVSENLNYSADGLKRTFGSHFKTVAELSAYAHNPEKIANRVYAGRMGNGDEASGDGFKTRGRGYIQLTGTDNYRAFGKAIGVDVLANPDCVASEYPLLSAAWFFEKGGLWRICDTGPTEAVVTAITKKVNGGTLGLSERLALFNTFYKLIKG